MLSYINKKIITQDWFWIINSKRKIISFAIILLTLFTYNVHEFFSYNVDYYNWFGYIHKVHYRNYYTFVANFFKYFNPILWCMAFYIYFYKETKSNIIFFIPISFCIARLLNVVSTKVDFNWYDEIINFCIVLTFIHFIFYLSSKIGLKTRKSICKHSILNVCEDHISNSYRKIQAFKKLKEKGNIATELYARYTDEELKKLKTKINTVLETSDK